jgi:hypothetical protein
MKTAIEKTETRTTIGQYGFAIEARTSGGMPGRLASLYERVVNTSQQV